MRLWSIHPRYLDSKGLVALWREALLAQKVLAGETRGYRHHPQLERFKKTRDPLGSLGTYLLSIVKEAEDRGYRFDSTKILKQQKRIKIPVTRGQVRYETQHLLKKLEQRDPERFRKLAARKNLETHPIFRSVAGPVEKWEKVSS